METKEKDDGKNRSTDKIVYNTETDCTTSGPIAVINKQNTSRDMSLSEMAIIYFLEEKMLSVLLLYNIFEIYFCYKFVDWIMATLGVVN